MIQDFVHYLDHRHVTDIRVIFDVGARDCKQSLEFARRFPGAKVFAFECNPQTLPLCRSAVHSNSRIVLTEKAVNTYDGDCTFFPINPERTRTTWPDGNPGASSLFRSNDTYTIETYVQDEITVPCVKLSTAMKQHDLSSVDLVWMDLQGAELLALQSFEEFLPAVRYVYTEVSHRPIYTGQVLFPQLETFMRTNGFVRESPVDQRKWQEDVIYRRQ